jgi:hypothetical protein
MRFGTSGWMTWIKGMVFFVIMAALALPAIQKTLTLVESKPLEGYFEERPRPEFSFSRLKSGDYQAALTPHLDRTIGFHNELTRVFNQCDYSLFSIPHAARIIVGKNGILQIDSHIEAYLGTDFAGGRYIDEKVSRIRYLQDYLWKNKQVRLLVILAPGKGFYYPESIPDRFVKGERGGTNTETYSVKLKEAGVNLIDFNRWLVQLKDTSRHNLYPLTGAHWSCYGAYLGADSLVRYLEKMLGRKLPHMVLDSLVMEPEARKEDDDMDRVLNLIWKHPVPVMTYPVFHHVNDSATPKPAVLFVSDSYYWYWHFNGIIANTFQRDDLWYYDKEVYPDQNTKPTNTGQISLDSALNRQEVVILMQTNGGYGDPGFGFVDRAYEQYYPGKTRIKIIEDNFRANPGWMEHMKEKAREQNLPLEAVLRNDAIYLYNNEMKRLSKPR